MNDLELKLERMMKLMEAQAETTAKLEAQLAEEKAARQKAEQAAREAAQRKERAKSRQEATVWGKGGVKVVKYAPRGKGEDASYGLVLTFSKVYASDGEPAPNPVTGVVPELNYGKGVYVEWAKAILDMPEELKQIVHDSAKQQALLADADLLAMADAELTKRQAASAARYGTKDTQDDDVSEAARLVAKYRKR